MPRTGTAGALLAAAITSYCQPLRGQLCPSQRWFRNRILILGRVYYVASRPTEATAVFEGDGDEILRRFIQINTGVAM
jgi:hypothetical protein